MVLGRVSSLGPSNGVLCFAITLSAAFWAVSWLGEFLAAPQPCVERRQPPEISPIFPELDRGGNAIAGLRCHRHSDMSDAGTSERSCSRLI
jgi:hypothetical protein